MQTHGPDPEGDFHLQYQDWHRILIVGDGDFSFALAFCQKYKCSRRLVATSYDSKSELLEKYTTARSNLAGLRNTLNVRVQHGVDATKLHTYFSPSSFDRVLFNFPHTGMQRVHLNRSLMEGFFKSAKYILRPTGQIHLTIKSGPPYTEWGIKESAAEFGTPFVASVPFRPTMFPGYHHRTTDPDARPLNTVRCQTWVFAPVADVPIHPEVLEQAAASRATDPFAPKAGSKKTVAGTKTEVVEDAKALQVVPEGTHLLADDRPQPPGLWSVRCTANQAQHVAVHVRAVDTPCIRLISLQPPATAVASVGKGGGKRKRSSFASARVAARVWLTPVDAGMPPGLPTPLPVMPSDQDAHGRRNSKLHKQRNKQRRLKEALQVQRRLVAVLDTRTSAQASVRVSLPTFTHAADAPTGPVCVYRLEVEQTAGVGMQRAEGGTEEEHCVVHVSGITRDLEMP